MIQLLQLELGSGEIGLAYFYFDYSDIAKRSTTNLLSSVIWQLANQQATSLKQLMEWASDQQSPASFSVWQAPPSPSMLEDLLAELTKTLKIVLVVDAIDESDDMKAVVSLLLRLQNIAVKVFFTSRPEITIRRVWSLETVREGSRAFELGILPTFVRPDIEIYVSDELDRLISTGELTLRDPALRFEIIKSLADRSDGM